MDRDTHIPDSGMSGLAELESAFAELAAALRGFPGMDADCALKMARDRATFAVDQYLPGIRPRREQTPEQRRFSTASDEAVEAALDWMDRDGADLESAAETVLSVCRRAVLDAFREGEPSR